MAGDERGGSGAGAEVGVEAALVGRLAALEARLAAAAGGPEPAECGGLLERLTLVEAQADAVLAALAEGRERAARHEAQFGELVEVVTALASLDYTQRVSVDEGRDESINALAIGLNMMAEEMGYAIEAMGRARDEALAANRAKSAFLANMSHEFRTPLNAIIGYAELAIDQLEGAGDPEVLSDLRRIHAAAHHVLNLIQDTLDISKIEADKLVLESRPLSVTRLVEESLATIAIAAEQRGNGVRGVVEVETEWILGDELRLRQVLLNLLSNANKFTDGGEIVLRARERVEGGTRWLDLAVSDTGIGIAADKQEVIFEAFVQADDSTTRKHGGTGLGLTISRRLCEMMGGALRLVSELGVGSTFTATLPVRPASAG